MRRMIAAGPPAKRPPHIVLGTGADGGVGRRVIVAALLLLASTVGAAAQSPEEPEIKPGEFIPAAPPQPAPQISLTGLDGKPVSLADFKGRFLILNLWATWCAPCLKEMPSLAALEANDASALKVLAVSEDHGGADVVAPFLERHDLGKLTIALDPQSTALHALHLRGLPTSLVIDGDGRVLGKVEGGADWGSDALRGTLAKLMAAAATR
jgi:thiol-disulfide isomerase/thioredoxin